MPEKEGVTPAARDYLELCRHAAACYPRQDPVLVAAARGNSTRVRQLIDNWHRSQGHTLPEGTKTDS